METQTLAGLLHDLPSEPSAQALYPELRRAVASAPRPLVAIDDDPTGAQTVYDTPVLLSWTQPEIDRALTASGPLLFILTNSRSVPSAAAQAINTEVGQRLAATRAHYGLGPLAVASRSDSTLRGHYPDELLALADSLGEPLDGHLLVPAFFEGGRYTIADTHWVAVPDARSPRVVPASETPYARDPVFGFETAYLPAWIEHKSRGRWRADQVRTVPLAAVRAGADAVFRALMQIEGGVPVVVNSAGYGDLTTFVLGLLRAEASGKRFLYRTAASFVRVRAGLDARPLLTAPEIYAACGTDDTASSAGLVVIGSYQPTTTEQIDRVLHAADLRPVPLELSVRDILAGRWAAEVLGDDVNTALERGALPVLFTSREVVAVAGDQNLEIGRRVMDALLDVVRRVTVRPRFVVAKGGITSHELARHGLGAAEARVLGQLQPGVPVWKLERGADLRFAGTPYVVFPGNVGGPDDLLAAVRTLRGV